MAVKMLERKERQRRGYWSSECSSFLPLPGGRTAFISSTLRSRDTFDISFGVFVSGDEDSELAGAAADNQNLLTLADAPLIGKILADYIEFVVNKRCRRNRVGSYKADTITFSPLDWGRYLATKRVLRQAMKKGLPVNFFFKEKEEDGVKEGLIIIELFE
jgi:hypothetical protein